VGPALHLIGLSSCFVDGGFEAWRSTILVWKSPHPITRSIVSVLDALLLGSPPPSSADSVDRSQTQRFAAQFALHVCKVVTPLISPIENRAKKAQLSNQNGRTRLLIGMKKLPVGIPPFFFSSLCKILCESLENRRTNVFLIHMQKKGS